VAGKTLRLEDLIGSAVDSVDGRRFGRIEEVIAERHGGELQLVEYHIGPDALLERWSLVGRLLGRRVHLYIVGWNQIDIAHRDRPRLLVPSGDLEKRAR
jgi:hypothetical protein